MEEVANDRTSNVPELPTGRILRPAERVLDSTEAGAGSGAARPMTVATMLTLPAFSGAELVAGPAGLERVVRRANVMEVPDIVPWVRPEALLLTTGYPLREVGTGLAELVAELDERGVSALAVKLHRYLSRLPQAMLAEADARGFPLVVVPDTAGFDEVLTQVFTNVVSERASLLERSEEVQRHLVDIVLSGGGVAEVTASVADLVGGVAMITTADGRVLSEAGDPAEVAAATGSTAFHPSGRFRTEVSTVGVHRLADLPGSLAVVAIQGGRIDHGRLVVFHRERVMSRADLAVLERAATVAAMSLTKEIAITAVESKYRGDFLRDVLAGRAGSAHEVVRHARSLGWHLDRPVVVVVAALETEQAPPMTLGYQGPLEVERFTAAWVSVVSRHDPTVPVVGFASEVVALLPVSGDSTPTDVVESALAGVAGDGGGGRRPFATGISRPVSSVDALPSAYEQARKALRVGRQLHGPKAVSYFDDLGVFRLLSLIEDAGELDGFVAETLGELAEPTEEAADLRRTLQVLLDTNLNVAQTARRLHFHYNTLRYRIGKLERAVGPFTTDPHLRLDLALALRIVGMRDA
jgi:purine catabolism regulator